MEINKFEEYRCYIMEEKKRFKEDVRTIFCAENGEIFTWGIKLNKVKKNYIYIICSTKY